MDKDPAKWKLTDERKRKIIARLKDGKDNTDIKQAIYNASQDNWAVTHGKTDISYICQSDARLSEFLLKQPKAMQQNQQHRHQQNQFTGTNHATHQSNHLATTNTNTTPNTNTTQGYWQKLDAAAAAYFAQKNQHDPTTAPNSQPNNAIQILFKQWKAWFKHKMQTKDSEIDWSFDMVLVWANYLTQKQITLAEFNQAKTKSFDSDWAPNNAQEFLKLARPNINTYPDAQTAFENACQECGKRGDTKRNWLHIVVAETAKRIGHGNLASCDNKYAVHFGKIYQQVITEHAQGATFTLPKTHSQTGNRHKTTDWSKVS